MKKFLFLILLIVCPFTIWSQHTVISGIVIDIETGETLLGATISQDLDGQSLSAATTDLDGSFTMSITHVDIPLVVNYLGYEEMLVQPTNLLEQATTIGLNPTSEILEVTTITGSRYEKTLADSPVSINVIKPRLLDNTNTTIFDKVLDKIPGVQIIDGQPNIRGGSGFSYGAGSRVLLLIDDVPAFQADAGRPLWDDIPVENISQVEVLKGASSALYGSAALNGIINVRTGYATSEPVTKANVSYTSYFAPKDPRKQWWDAAPYQLNAGLVHKQKFGKLDVVASGFYEQLEGFVRGQFKDKYRIGANLKYRLSDRVTLSMNTMYNYKSDGSHLLWNDPTSGAYLGWIDANDPDGDGNTYTESQTNRFYLDPQVTIFDKRNNKHKVITRFYALDNASTTEQATGSTNYFLEYQFTSRLSALGLDYTLGSSAYLTRSRSELFGNVALSADNYALYGQLEKRIKEKLTVTIGTRYEFNLHDSPVVMDGDEQAGGTVSEDRLVSRLGLNYKLKAFTNLRASWGQGYRFPTLAERFIRTQLGSFSIIPNPELTSESGWTAELGIKQGVNVGNWQGYVDVAAFSSRYDNMMEFTFIPSELGFQSQNVGDTEINGFEFNLISNSKIGKHPLNIIFGYTYVDPRYRNFEDDPTLDDEERAFRSTLRAGVSVPVDPNESRNVLKYRNRHNLKADIEFTYNKWTTGINYNYTSEQVTIDQFLSMLNGIGEFRELNRGYTRVDTRLSYDFGSFKISLIGNNVLNEEYAIRPGILEAPRNLAVRLDATF